MCKYCENSNIIFEKEIISPTSWGWGNEIVKISQAEALEQADTHILFIDRGHLRLSIATDCDCLDHGESIKIQFCPFCGKELL